MIPTMVSESNMYSLVKFLPSLSLEEYLDLIEVRHPELHRRLDLQRLSLGALTKIYGNIDALSTHFESKEKGGRGDAYRAAQQRNPLIRSKGINRLFEMVTPYDTTLSPKVCIIDALGGNGTLTRAMRQLKSPEQCPTIFTSDVAAGMVEDALAQELPAIRQPAQCMLFGDCTVDGIIFAYGTHHIPPCDRPQAIKEAFRVLRSGGRIVVQDFEEGTPTARWYSELLDKYTCTGHQHKHFTRGDMLNLLAEAGFEEIEIHDVYDPCILYDDIAECARVRLLNYLITLFSLEKMLPLDQNLDAQFWQQVERLVEPYSTFTPAELPKDCSDVRQFTVMRENGHYRAELPRVALVAVAEKP